jgi:phosphoglycolate phosphatase-like HAD superfamily hydrolase
METKRLIKQRKQFLVCLDSDGTVFNTMDIKHKECIIPAIISNWELQDISTYVVETAEYVNLYSKYRGINRFQALIKVFDILSEMSSVQESGFELPQIDSLRKWVESTSKLGNNELKAIAEKTGDPILRKTYDWSKAIDKCTVDNIYKVHPFPFVLKSLEIMARHADIIVVSSESGEILSREWEENGLLSFVNAIAGREAGSKKEILNLIRAAGYETNSILMIGDAPGDLEAANSNNILFYPVNPRFESDSWQKLYEEAFGAFIKGCYKGSYQDKLISEFTKKLDYFVRTEI